MSTGGSTLSLHGGEDRRPGEVRTEPQLVIALECSRPAAGAARLGLGDVACVRLGRGEAREVRRRSAGGGDELDIRIPDRWMSSGHARLERSFGRWMLHDEGSKNGTRVRGARTSRAELEDGDLFELGSTLFRFRAAVPIAPGDPRDLDLGEGGGGLAIPTLVPELSRELARAERLAATDIAILVGGETGTGKEVLARALHRQSGRRGPFVAVNCGAIPEHLVESELFGHKKGAFSGADEEKPGLVRSAHGGTLFLDEIGDLRPTSQAALLRVLQEREVLAVGSHRPVPVDIRLISATHCDLAAMVETGAFRRDLFARIAGFCIEIPALRARRDDVGHLIGALHKKAAGADHPGLDVDAGRHLLERDWPLNVRELETTLAAAAALAGTDPIALEHIPAPSARADSAPPARVANAEAREISSDERRVRDELVAALRRSGGNVSAAARALEKDRKQIQRWVKRFGLDPASFRHR